MRVILLAVAGVLAAASVGCGVGGAQVFRSVSGDFGGRATGNVTAKPSVTSGGRHCRYTYVFEAGPANNTAQQYAGSTLTYAYGVHGNCKKRTTLPVMYRRAGPWQNQMPFSWREYPLKVPEGKEIGAVILFSLALALAVVSAALLVTAACMSPSRKHKLSPSAA